MTVFLPFCLGPFLVKIYARHLRSAFLCLLAFLQHPGCLKSYENGKHSHSVRPSSRYWWHRSKHNASLNSLLSQWRAPIELSGAAFIDKMNQLTLLYTFHRSDEFPKTLGNLNCDELYTCVRQLQFHFRVQKTLQVLKFREKWCSCTNICAHCSWIHAYGRMKGCQVGHDSEGHFQKL